MSQGQPKTILAQLTPGSFYHSIVSAIESISENREPQEAADIMTRAKTKPWRPPRKSATPS